MSDLSLTGTSISPEQKGSRSYSARSSRSSLNNFSRTNTENNSKSLRDSTSAYKPKRTKPAMALEFPKSTKPATGRHAPVQMPRTDSSQEYLSFFNTPRSRSASTKVPKNSPRAYHSISTYSDVGKSNTRPERDRLRSSLSSEKSSTSEYRKAHSVDVPIHTHSRTPPVKYASNKYGASTSKNTDIFTDATVVENIPKSPTRDALDEDDAAKTIQTWYKRHAQRSKSSEAALKRMLQQKKVEMEGELQEDKMRTKQRSDEEKRQQRRDREREERRRAIMELRKSREEKEQYNKSLVEEEMAAIAEKQRKNNRPKRKSEYAVISPPTVSDSQVIQNVENKIDKIFEETKMASESTIPTFPPGANLSEDDESIPEELPESATDTMKSQGLLESLLETIQQLEAEPEQLRKIETRSKLDEKLAWIEDMQSEHLSVVSNPNAASSVNGAGDFVDGANSVTSTNSLLTKAKLSNLMEFLDNVETQDENYETERLQSSRVKPAENSDLTKVSQLVAAEKAASEVTTELLKLRLDNDEKTKSVDLLKKALSQQRELTIRHSQEQEKEMNQRLKMQKEQYESTIQRHLSFIDQLIDDKKVLGEKCERVVLEMKQSESKYQKKIKEMQETHTLEIKKQKEILSAAEKLRREKWIEEKTRTIKEITVKGLEPEIQRLIAKHKQEVKKLKAIHEAELLQSDERAGQRYIRQTEELREHLEREKEAACNREREMARQRYEKQLEQEEMALQQQRRRLYAEVADEKERLNEQAARQRADIDRLKEQLENHNSLATSALTDEYKKSKEEAERRHQAEIETLKERLELEKQAWQETYMKKQEAFVLQKERELKDAVRHTRDSEIESVIEQLEKDMRVQRDQIEKTAENRIKRIREKYESELKEIEVLERQTQEKYNNMKVQYSDMEGDNMRLKSVITQKEQEIVDVKKVKNKLVEERGNVTDIIRDEFAERLVHTEEENKRMKNEIAQMRARHRLELDRVNQEKEDELSEVHKRVKAAIVKKEEAVAQIKLQHGAAVKRADHLEGLLEAQRKQLLSKKK